MFNRYPRTSHYPSRFGQPNWQNTRARRANPVAIKTYTADRVFAAAVAAQEVNGEYLKYERRDPDTGTVTARPNKEIMREFLEQDLTAAQKVLGQQIRDHYHKLLFQQMSGELKDFLATALRVSTKETFANNDWLDLAIVAALPSCYQRDVNRESAREERKELAATSQPVGQPGDRISGEFRVVQCNWSQKWQVWTVNAQQGANMFFFFLPLEVQPGQTIRMSGTVKGHRDGNITQLNRVRMTKS
jgi:hypothetical protein